MTAGRDEVRGHAAAALHGLLDLAGPAPVAGEPLPPMWHWLAFLPQAAQRDLGPDGHPRTDDVAQAAGPQKRMFAGARLTMQVAPRVGETLHRESTVSPAIEKSGRSGPLTFVTIRHDVRSESGGAVVEEHDLVYRPASAPVSAQPASGEAPSSWPWRWELPIDPVVLFRFSALTYNSHRIHYDRPYATGVEGYPGLVVHGPLQALALGELCRREAPGKRMLSFAFRAVGPAFDDGPLLLLGRPHEDGAELAAFAADGRRTMEAKATFTSGA